MNLLKPVDLSSMVLVTGSTGSGKSTTLAAMLDHINRNRDAHILTIEDPVEFVHKHKKSIINQREVQSDTHSFPDALKYVLRQDPDVILIGEIRDADSMKVALTAADTGHLVLSTMHTIDATQTVSQAVDAGQSVAISTTADPYSRVYSSLMVSGGSLPFFRASVQTYTKPSMPGWEDSGAVWPWQRWWPAPALPPSADRA